MTATQTFEELARAVDDAAARVRELPHEAREQAEGLRAAIEAVHRAGLVTIVRRLREDPVGRELLFELVDDPTVRMLLSLHAIIRTPPPQPAPPKPRMIPLTPVARRPDPTPADEPGWVRTKPIAELPDGEVTAVGLVAQDGSRVDAIVVRVGEQLTAFRDECAHQGLPLGGALVDADSATLVCPWHGYSYDAVSGECMSLPGARLQALPLRIVDDHVWVRVTP